MNDILLKLSEIKCSHNDIKPTDILVLNKKLMLIDFQWATEKGSSMPAGWPNYIGRTFKKSDKTYDDQFSFRKSIQWIIGNKTL
jgi:tRNA A-37 threonylcarbamoyl transferase component Bud32